MSKYGALGSFLKKQPRDEVRLSFAKVEALVGAKLPRSASYRAWWSNNAVNSVMTKVWLDAGFKTEQVDMDAKTLVFRRAASSSRGKSDGKTHPLFGALKGLTRLKPGADLTAPADPGWAERA